MAASYASTVGTTGDLIGEILAWLPPKSVIRFRSVCKQWLEITVTASFAAAHTRRNPHRIAGFLLREVSPVFNASFAAARSRRNPHGIAGFMTREVPHLYSKIYDASCPLGNGAARAFPEGCTLHNDRPTRMIRSCNGLILCTETGGFRFRFRRLWVYNPTTGRCRAIPKIHYVAKSHVVLAFEPSRSSGYRIILAPFNSHRIEVYDSETDMAESFFMCRAPWTHASNPWQWHSCSCNGVVYWLNDDDGSLVAFDIEQRSVSGALARPPMHSAGYVTIRLHESRGRLLLIRHNVGHASNTAAVIQVLEMRSDHSRWTMLHNVHVKDVLAELFQASTTEVELASSCFAKLREHCWLLEGGEEEDDVLVVCIHVNQAVAYNLTSRRLHNLLLSNDEKQELTILCPCSNTLAAP